MNTQRVKDLVVLNLGVLFISTSGVLGRYITMSPELTIFWRATVATILLLVICWVQKLPLFKDSPKDLGRFFLGGFLMMVHWVTYFYSLQLSNVAIGMLSLFTFPVITAFLEPFFLGTKFQKIHLFLGLLTLLGVYFLVPDVGLSGNYGLAIGYGLLSAFSYALRNILMKSIVQQHNGLKLMCYQTMAIAVLLSPFLFSQGLGSVVEQWWAVLFLALFTTVIGHTLFLISFRKFSITTASIMSCTQAIFGIILGMIFLSEFPHWTTYIGGVLILTAVVIESYTSVGVQQEIKS